MVRSFAAGRIRVFRFWNLLLLVSLFLFGPALNADPIASSTPTVQGGLLDLRDWLPARGSVALAGEWEFFPGKLLAADSPEATRGELLTVPGLWNAVGTDSESGTMGSFGCGTYRLRLLLPEDVGSLALRLQDAATAYRLYVNGRLSASNGTVACAVEDYAPRYLPVITMPSNLRSASEGENEILLHVANFVHSKGGQWESIQLGYAAELFAQRERAVWTDLFLTGSFLTMSLYHFGLFLLRRTDRSSLFFGILCLTILVRLLVTGERLMFQNFPDFPFWLGQQLEYLSIYLATPAFAMFFWTSFRQEMHRSIVLITLVIHALLALSVLLLPQAIYSQTLMVFFVSAFLLTPYGTTFLIRATTRKRDGAFAALLGFVFFTGAAINDILASENAISTPLLLPVGLFLFIFSQSFMLSLRFSLAFRSVEQLSAGLQLTTRDLQETNSAYARFVPAQFLSLLNKDSIRDIRLGDQIQSEMTVLFSDIVDFTGISETLTPKENFDFLNAYLSRMQTPIGENHGFIDKYIGDSVMALFPRNPTDAVQAAVDMQIAIREYNHQRMEQGFQPIGVRIGVHTGSLMLGTIGSSERMEGTVISDSVNLASRLEGLNRKFGTYIMISEQTLNGLTNPGDFQIRRLGRVQVKGKREHVRVYEVFNGLSPVLADLLNETRENFEAGLSAFERRDMASAVRCFEGVLDVHPGDEASRLYLNECSRRAPTG